MSDLPEIIEKKYVHKGYFDLRVDLVKRKNVDPIEYTVLLTKVGAVAVLPQDEEGRYIVTKEYRHSIGMFVLSLPGGRMEKGEEPEIAAKRELIEETGYQAKALTPLQDYFPMPSVCDQKIYMYLAKGCVKIKNSNLDPLEVIETHALTEKELMQELKKGAKIDGVLAAGLFYNHLHSKF